MGQETVDLKSDAPFWLPELDGLRSLAFILVFYHHTIGTFWRDTPGNSALYKTLIEVDLRIHNWGWVGVDLFFVLSAFLITSLLLREKAAHADNSIAFGKFMMRRILRIWPLYFFYLALVAALCLTLSPAYAGANLTEPRAMAQFLSFAIFTGNFAMITQGIVLPLVNPMWSLCIEEQFYLVWGGCMKLIKDQRILIAILAFMALMAPVGRYYLLSNIGARNYMFYYLNSLTHCDAIVWGGLTAFLWRSQGEKFKSSKFWQMIFALGTLVFLLPLAVVPYIEASDSSIIWVMSSIALGFTCLVLTTLSNQTVRAFFSLSFLRHIGKLTYGLYMFHFLVVYSLVWVARNNLHVTNRLTFILLSWPLGLFLTYILARLSWRFIETPALGLKKRFVNR